MNRVVVFVGVLTEYQGIDILIEAIPLVVREFPKAKFLIIGYPNEDAYQQKARQLGVDEWAHFTGRILHAEIPRYLSLADAAVSPKTSVTEANLKLFEYMAMGLPTVVFDNPVNREILGDLGVYAKMGDMKSLADALVRVLRDREWAQQLGARARQKAREEYSWLGVGKRLSDIYSSVANASQRQSLRKGACK